MPTEITSVENPNEMFRLARELQIVEADLARGVYNVFNSGDALKKIQGVAKVIMRMMLEGPRLAFSLSIGEEGNLRLWEKVPKNRTGFTMWQSPVLLKRLDATDCADLIRLAGCWVEKGGLGDLAPASVKDAFRVEQRHEIWGRTARVRDKGWEIDHHLVSHMRDPNASFSGMGGVGGKHGKFSKRAAGSSSVLKLDRLFGLLVACDISGTTADTVFALEFFGASLGLTPGYYMLPIGTIVSNMHHSVIEVALAICINGSMEYYIGFPETLKPKKCLNFTSELSEISGVLQSANMKMKKLHHLRYYEGSRPKGIFKIDNPLEVTKLRNSRLSNAKEMLAWASGGGYPSRDDVVWLMRNYCNLM